MNRFTSITRSVPQVPASLAMRLPTWLLATLVAWVALITTSQAADRPNILFLFADDLSYEAVGWVERAEVATPHLDQLARRGLSFRHAYNMGSWSGAVCIASRTMLNTGRMLWAAEPLQERLDEERTAGRIWSTQLQRLGYRTYFTGKWHVNLRPEACFDQVRHVRPGMPKDVPQGYDRPHADRPDPWSPTDPQWDGYWQGGRHWTEVTADDACDYLVEAAGSSQPFMMYVAFNAPHDPRQAPAEFLAQYPLDQIRLPTNFLPTYPFHLSMGCGPDLRDERLAPFPRTELAVRVHRQEYFACISHLDQQIGRILDTLERTGQVGKTIVIFTADHGLAVGHHGLWGKQNQYAHSVRVPFLIAGPGVPADRSCAAPIYLQDVMPTTLEIAGGNVPDFVQFESFRPWIADPSRPPGREAIYGAYLDRQRMVQVGDFKLILYPHARRARLYDLGQDPEEQADLADSPAHAATIERLWQELRQQQIALNDPLDLTGTYAEWSRSATRDSD